MMSDNKPSAELARVHAQRKQEEDNYTANKKSLSVWAPVTGGMFVANVFLGWLAFYHFPQVEYVPTANAAAMCNVSGTKGATVDLPTIVDFAVDVAVCVNTYDFKNYQRQIETCAQRNFTEDYRNAYVSAFGQSRVLKNVIENYFVVSATTAGTGHVPVPSRRSAANSAGPDWWLIDVPLLVSYSAGNKAPTSEKLLLKVKVVRVPPSTRNPRGLAVESIESSYLLESRN
ncbi:DotI/IcmL family type IV secretion protein [Cupriavidus sp. TMH.W2]|uniref:DotI/IcmL family type IV secretion protein n=1 Tax=Cupriavidus sp. TMH.W2 TaxID=3434465 RepID=UPI003D78566F